MGGPDWDDQFRMLVYRDGLTNAALVRAMGQIELLFTLITSVWFLGERVRRREVLGMLLLVIGILLLI
ncbi:MAG: hypothetical protein CM15mP120_14710 [Pseudomonadota bacterium]|nr:MAG: hypothetical protein CM15mP120_14710 [Pseudomonadota bacterium]